jgi:predicted phosphodiesterase
VRAIGVISDTHGLLREEALQALAGSDLIIHAGDVGKLEILERLSEIAPVRAVYGNTDWGELRGALPGTDVLHIFETLDLDPVAAGFRVVIFGHTHEPLIREHEGVLYLNPGSAGSKRPDLPVTVARLTLEGEDLRAEIVDLTTGKVPEP